MRKFIVKTVIIGVLGLFLCPIFSNAQQLELYKSVDSTTIQTGNQLVYTIQYSCVSTTAHCDNVVIRDTLPSDLTFVSFLGNPIHSSNTSFNAADNEVIFELNKENGGMGMLAGSTGEVKIYARFPNGETPNNTLINNTAFITSTIATDTFSNMSPSTALATSPWELNKTGNGTAYLGLPFTYTLQIEDPTNGANGGLNIDNVTVVDTLPTGAAFNNANNGGVYDATHHTVTWTVGSLTVGSNSNNLQVTVTYSDATFDAGDMVTNEAIFLGQPVGEPSITLQGTDAVTKTLVAPSPGAGVTKTIIGSATPIIGDTLQYDIEVTNSGTTPLDTFYMVDTLPAALNLTKIETGTFTGANLTIRYKTNLNGTFQTWTGSPFNGGTNTTLEVSALSLAGGEYVTILEYDFEEVPLGFENTAIQLFAVVINPDHDGMMVDNDTIITNCANLNYELATVEYQAAACVMATVRDTILPSVDFEKQGSNNEVPIGRNFSYVMILLMNGDFAMDSIVMIDTIPENMAFYQTESGGWNNLNEDVEVYYQTNLNSTFQTWSGSPYAPTSDTQLPVSALGLAANETVTVIKWIFRNPQRDFAHNGSRPRIYGTIQEIYPDGSASMKGDIITNCTYVTAYLDGVAYAENSCDDITVDDAVIRGDPDKHFIVNGSDAKTAGPFAPGDTITYQLEVENGSSSSDTLVNPILLDLLPTQVSYVAGSSITVENSNGFPEPILEVIENYNNTGRTLLRWSWTGAAAAEFAPSDDYFITFKVVVNPNVFQEEVIYNYGYQTTNDSPNYSCEENSIADTNDLDGDGLTTDILCYDNTDVTFTVFTLPSLASEKLVKGQLDTVYTKFPEFGETVPGGDANYQLFVRNQGTVPMTNVVVIDILPFVGDMGVIDLSMRDTRWRPFLIGPLNAPTGVTVYYSTEQNPCRSAEDIVPSGPAGCTAPNWTTIPPIDITTVQSFKLDFGDIIINPGDELMIDWDMKAPVNVLETIGSPPDSIAWNSFGYIADRVNTDGSIGAALLPSEPIKVGIRVQDPTNAALGNFVWLDADKDGIQDMGEAGVDGVTVHLYVDNGDGIADPPTDSLAATTLTATGGLYLFPELLADDYFVAFYPPPTYTVTLDNILTNDSLDSDGIDTLINGVPVALSQVVSLSFSETNPTLDLGLYQTDIASVGNYVWFDENEDGLQNEPTANGVNGISVYLYDNGGLLQGSTTTQNDLNGSPGYYLFDSIPPADYYIEFEVPTSFRYSLAQQGAGGSDATDSDATSLVGDTLRARTETFTLVANQYDPTWDAGIILPTGNVSLGNFVWIDTDNDGVFNNGENGINGVTVNLYQDTDSNGVFTPMTDAFFATTTTATNGGNPGYYLFDNLPEGNYIVQIAKSNFNTGQILGNYNSSNGNGIAPDPDDNTNFDDNGEPLAGYGVVSQAITLSEGDEPINDEDTDNTSNLTVDFGFFSGDACLISIANFSFGNCSESTGSPIIEMSFDVTWLDAPDPAETIQVEANGIAQTAIITTAESNGSQSFTINIPADGTSSDIKVWFTTSTICGDTLTYTAPTGCPLAMIKTVDTLNAAVGDTVNYTYTVYNNSTDTVTLSNITDDKIGTISTIQAGAARTTDSLIALYYFSNGSGTIISDVSGFGSPLDLTIEGTNYSWGTDSLNFIPANRASNATDMNKIFNEITASNALTVEAWVMPAASSQGGPARIVTLSQNGSNRNFSLMQNGTSFQVRLRSGAGNNNGSNFTLDGGTSNTSAPQHLVFTRAANEAGVLYQNGVVEDTQNFTGDFSAWGDTYDFGIGNEFSVDEDNTSRDFQGTFYVVAVYSKALSSTEVTANYTAGLGPFSAPTVLLPGDSAIFTAAYKITAADLPSPVINTAAVTGTFKNSGDITVSDTAGVNILCTDITATFTFAKCHNNGTAGIVTADDYQIYQVSATHAGAGTQYQVILNLGLASEQVLATANYGNTILVGSTGQMQADGSSTYTLTVRDVTDTDCQESVNIPAIAACSDCAAVNCVPIQTTVIRGNKG